jgi:RimJ/RimL family protein N-acetyltransferase
LKYIIETERLKLREFEYSDAEFIFKLLNSPGWLKYIGKRNINNLVDAENYIENVLREGYRNSSFGFYLMELKTTGEKTGMCGLVKRPGLEYTDIGFALLDEFENKGYAFEASLGVLSFARDKLKLSKIAAITVSYNQASIKLLEKLGMGYEKVIKLPNDPEDLLLYSIQL